VKFKTAQIGLCPSGIDAYHKLDHKVFQIPAKPDQPLARLQTANNVLLDDEGVPETIASLTSRVSGTAVKTGFSGAGLLLMQDGGTIKLVNPSTWATSNLVTGLTASERVIFHEHLDTVYWTNGQTGGEVGKITSAGTATNWGCDTPVTPTLTAVSGSLRAGRYLVTASVIDGNGLEHSAPEAEVITVDGTEAIQVSFGTALDSNAAYAKLYCSMCNGTELYYSKKVAVGSLPGTITAEPTSNENRPPGQFCSPPIGCDGIATYRGRILIWIDNEIYPSRAGIPHLFPVENAVDQRPTNVLAVAGLSEGFWSICEDGAYWTQGSLGEWATRRRDGNRAYAAGSLVVPGYLIPALQTNEEVALFMSSDGLVAGLPTGQLVPLTFERLSVDVDGKRVTICVHEINDGRFIIPLLEDI